jgi:hypothetical protein
LQSKYKSRSASKPRDTSVSSNATAKSTQKVIMASKKGKSLKRGVTPTPAVAVQPNRFTLKTWNRSRVNELMAQIRDLKESDKHLFR